MFGRAKTSVPENLSEFQRQFATEEAAPGVSPTPAPSDSPPPPACRTPRRRQVEEPKSKGHFVSTSAPMTEAEFRSWLVSGGISDALIEETIAGARAASKKAA